MYLECQTSYYCDCAHITHNSIISRDDFILNPGNNIVVLKINSQLIALFSKTKKLLSYGSVTHGGLPMMMDNIIDLIRSITLI